MANTIKEYTAGVNADGTTYEITSASLFTTPDYLSGRGETDIEVRVNDILKVLNLDYIFVNSTSIAFASARLPEEGDKVSIIRNTNQDSRLTDYANGSLLTAEVLDADANQIFNMAQEALDKAEATRVGKETFYYKQDEPPTDIVSGTLWFDTSSSPNSLMVYNGEQWHHTAPIVSETNYSTSSSEYIGHFAAGATTPEYDMFKLPKFTAEREVFLNGIKLQGSLEAIDATLTAEWAAGEIDYLTTTHASFVPPAEVDTHLAILISGQLTANDRLTVKTSHGGYPTTVTEAEANVKQIQIDVTAMANNATDLAESYADNPEDVSFDVNGVPTYSAKHYAAKSEEHKDAASNLVSGFNSTVSTETANFTAHVASETSQFNTNADAKELAVNNAGTTKQAALESHYNNLALDLNQINYTIDQGIYDLQSLNSANSLFAEGAVDVPFHHNGVAHYSAKHYAQKAEDAANVSVDSLSGWTILDSETITTQGNQDPSMISTTSFDITAATTCNITAPDGVVVNNVPTPIAAGEIDLDNDTWTGTAGYTVSEHNRVYTFNFPTPFNSADDYYVIATLSGSEHGSIRVVKSTTSFTIQIQEHGNTSTSYTARVNTGKVAIQLLKHT